MPGEAHRRVVEERLRQVRKLQQELALEEGQLLAQLQRLDNEAATKDSSKGGAA